MPNTWAKSIMVPIFKNKGDPAECSNYYPIQLPSHTMGIFEWILDKYICKVACISVNQCGYKRGFGTTDAVSTACQILQNHKEKQRSLHMTFLDLKKAFDPVPHRHLLHNHGVPEQLIKWVQMLYINMNSHVTCAAGESVNFSVKVGVHLVSSLSPLPLILVMDTITRDLQWEIPWTLLYADNVMLTVNTREDLQEQM